MKFLLLLLIFQITLFGKLKAITAVYNYDVIFYENVYFKGIHFLIFLGYMLI
jgi:hypothetical protein